MILRPVKPQSPCGPPITKRPVGFTRNLMSPLMSSAGSVGLMTSSITASRSVPQIDVRRMLRGQHDGVDRMRLAVDITHGDLRLRIRTQPGQTAVAAQIRLTLDQTVRQVDRQRHQFRRFVARVAEHQALVAGALIEVVVVRAVHALGDVRRLLVVRDEHRAAAVVDAVVGVVVADALDRVARDLDVIDVGGGGDFTCQHDETGVAQRFGSDARVFVLSQDGVENGVGDLIRDLVGMAFGDGFGSEEIVVCHVADS